MLGSHVSYKIPGSRGLGTTKPIDIWERDTVRDVDGMKMSQDSHFCILTLSNSVKIREIHWTSVKIRWLLWKSVKFREIPLNSMKFCENLWNSLKNQPRIIIWDHLWNGHCRINCISIDDLFFCSSICIRELFRTTHVYNFNYCSINFICLLINNQSNYECVNSYNVSWNLKQYSLCN